MILAMRASFVIVDAVVVIKIRIALQRCGLSGLQKPLLYSQSSRVRPRIILYTYILYKTMYTSGKKRTSFLVKTKYKENVENQKIEFYGILKGW